MKLINWTESRYPRRYGPALRDQSATQWSTWISLRFTRQTLVESKIPCDHRRFASRQCEYIGGKRLGKASVEAGCPATGWPERFLDAS